MTDTLKIILGGGLFGIEGKCDVEGVTYGVERPGKLLQLCGLILNLEVTQLHSNMTHLRRGKTRLCE